jgi:hypothetical protein
VTLASWACWLIIIDNIESLSIPKRLSEDSAEDRIKRRKTAMISYPLDGIDIEKPETYLPRKELVDRVIAQGRDNGLVVLKSPPGTGKTSLLYLIEGRSTEGTQIQYVRPSRSPSDANFDLFDYVWKTHGVCFEHRKIDTKYHGCTEIWLLFDDAQKLYGKKFDPFWEAVVKMRGRKFSEVSHAKVIVMISATYYLNNRSDSPVALRSEASFGIRDLLFTQNEALQAFKLRSARPQWVNFHAKLFYLTNGAAAPYTIGINFLHRRATSTDNRGDSQNQVTEEQVTQLLVEGTGFINELDRCYPATKVTEDAHRVIFDAVLVAYKADEGTSSALYADDLREKAIDDLCRAGILLDELKFTSPATAIYYYSKLFPRAPMATERVTSLEDLVKQATEKISARRLRAARETKKSAPKEAVFQQLFHEALYSVLPLDYHIIPELGTKAKIDGRVVTGELDFYIKNGKNWALELLRDGDRIGEHLDRIPGKYRNVDADEWLVVDFRFVKRRQKIDSNLCSLVFSEDFLICYCYMRDEADYTELKLTD